MIVRGPIVSEATRSTRYRTDSRTLRSAGDGADRSTRKSATCHDLN